MFNLYKFIISILNINLIHTDYLFLLDNTDTLGILCINNNEKIFINSFDINEFYYFYNYYFINNIKCNDIKKIDYTDL